MKISLFSLVLKDMPLEEVLKLAADIGYDGVELWGREPHSSADTSADRAKQIRSMLDFYGLELPSIGSYIGDFSTKSDDECRLQFEELEKYLELMQILKCDMLRVAPGGPNAFLVQKYHYEKSFYWMGKCADLAKQYNTKIIMEIHNESLIETVEAADEYLKNLNKPNVGLIHDAGNMYITDTDYGIKSVEILNNKIFHVHVKDELRIDNDSLPGAFHSRTIYGDEIFQQKLLGEGAVDHMPLLKSLIKIGYNGFLSIECHAAVSGEMRARHDFEVLNNQVKSVKESLQII